MPAFLQIYLRLRQRNPLPKAVIGFGRCRNRCRVPGLGPPSPAPGNIPSLDSVLTCPGMPNGELPDHDTARCHQMSLNMVRAAVAFSRGNLKWRGTISSKL